MNLLGESTHSEEKGLMTMKGLEKRFRTLALVSGVLAAPAGATAQSSSGEKVPVDVYSYVRAETDLQFKGYAQRFHAFGKFAHGRDHYPIDNQVTHSGNRDTIYSFGVFDLTTPLTVTLPTRTAATCRSW